MFNQDRFHALNLREGQRVVRASPLDDEGRMIGTFAGVLDGDALINGFSAPFGGVDLARPRETPANVSRLVEEAVTQFRAEGARLVRVKLPPACYGENEHLIQITLLNSGFTVELCELNQHIDLHGVSRPDQYVAQLKSPARRALNKPSSRNLLFREALAGEWSRAYSVLETNRTSRGRQLSLSREYLERARTVFGDRVRMFELLDGETSVAAALIYRVREDRELVVYWGDGDHALEHSPMNMLACRVVEQALADRVSTVDLGIANERVPGRQDLVINRGLVQFKQSVLARIEPRLTLVKELA